MSYSQYMKAAQFLADFHNRRPEISKARRQRLLFGFKIGTRPPTLLELIRDGLITAEEADNIKTAQTIIALGP